MATLRVPGQRDADRRLAVARRAGQAGQMPRPFYGQGPIHEALNWRGYRKTTVTYAVQMDEAFEVETLEGVMAGKAGDWLACGTEGELYPIDNAVFRASYVRDDG